MVNPPSEIDQASVVAYIILEQKHQNTGNTSHIVKGELLTEFNGLAICKYSDSKEHYLFYCNDSWE